MHGLCVAYTTGSAYVFVNNGGVWVQKQKLLASDGAANDAFGGWVAVHRCTIVIGGRLHDSSMGTNTGK